MRSWIRDLALCSACRGRLPRLGFSLSPVTTRRGVTLHPAAESPSLLQCDVQVRELTEDDWGSIPNFPPDDLRGLQQIIEPPCTSTFSSVKWELKQVPPHTFEVRTE